MIKKFYLKDLAIMGICSLILIFIFEISIPSLKEGRVMVVIPSNAGSKEIACLLSQQKLIKNENLFILISRIFGWEKDLKAGRYEFTFSDNIINVLSKLKKGQVSICRLTIPEGLPWWGIADLLSREKIIKKEDFARLIKSPQIFKKEVSFPLPKDSLEGYLYPDTYYFTGRETSQEVIKKFLSRFQEEVIPLYEKGKSKFSLKEIVILASIIEKEAQVFSEKPIISAVFYNRLQRGMKLRADPTVKYALGSFREKLTYDDLKVSSSYNTYLYYGLPPTPISNPGKESIYAALHPIPVDYLYFVAKGDGTHKFSRTYEEHLKAIYKYRKS
mgnify:CR=1 FL=1